MAKPDKFIVDLLDQVTMVDSKGMMEIVKIIPVNQINEYDSNGFTVLLNSIAENHQKVFEYLIKHEANVNKLSRDNKTSPLHRAAAVSYKSSGDSSKIIQMLLNKKADPYVIDGDKCSPLHYAVFENNLKNVELLAEAMRKNIDIASETTNFSALHLAANLGKKIYAKKLLDNKADINKQDKEGKTPLYYVIECFAGRKKAEQELEKDIKSKTDEDKKKNNDLKSSYQKTAESKELIEMLIHNQAINLTLKDKKGLTALQFEKNNGESTIVQDFVKARYAELIIDSFRKSSERGSTAALDIMELLDQKETREGLETVELINHPLDKDGNTLVHMAIKTQNATLLSQLRKIPGVDFDKSNKQGETPTSLISKVVADGKTGTPIKRLISTPKQKSSIVEGFIAVCNDIVMVGSSFSTSSQNTDEFKTPKPKNRGSKRRQEDNQDQENKDKKNKQREEQQELTKERSPGQSPTGTGLGKLKISEKKEKEKS